MAVYCAGVTEPLDSRSDLWDLYVDVPALTMSVSDSARKDFAMTSVHKDVAAALIKAYADGEVTCPRPAPRACLHACIVGKQWLGDDVFGAACGVGITYAV